MVHQYHHHKECSQVIIHHMWRDCIWKCFSSPIAPVRIRRKRPAKLEPSSSLNSIQPPILLPFYRNNNSTPTTRATTQSHLKLRVSTATLTVTWEEFANETLFTNYVHPSPHCPIITPRRWSQVRPSHLAQSVSTRHPPTLPSIISTYKLVFVSSAIKASPHQSLIGAIKYVHL